MRHFKVLAVAVCCAVILGTVALYAQTTETIQLSNPNPAVSGYTGPFATVTLTCGGTNCNTVAVSFTGDSNGGNNYYMIDGGSADLNVNGSYSLSGVSATGPGGTFANPIYKTNSPGQVDGFGNFDLSLNFFDGFDHAAETISFTITDSNVSGWGNILNVLVPNSGGSDAAVHTAVCSSPCSPAAGALATGYAANGAQVPEPTSLAMLGCSGLIGLIPAIRRKLRV